MRIAVDLAKRSYEVVLGDDARHELSSLLDARAPEARTVALVTSTTLRHQSWFDLESGRDQHVLEVPDGESAKSFATLEQLCDAFAALGLSRRDVVVAVGGGAVTDLVGFAAASYLRGIGVVHVPTSVVGQVDAAIGGKTAINLRSGKNLVGAFHQPLGVLCDSSTLLTLPERERVAGLGEVAKCWLLEGRTAEGLGDAPLADLVALSIRLKASIVSGDEFEGGARALLNYGHTLAHALELLALERNADELRHGEAVALGLAYAVRLARALGRVSEERVAEHDAVLATLGLSPRFPRSLSTASLVEVMGHDKKAHHDLTFVLPGSDGFELVAGIDPALVSAVLERFRDDNV